MQVNKASRINSKQYARIVFELASPLAIGSGDNSYTDKDIIKNSKGNPYIPATAIAGVIKSRYEGSVPEDAVFGFISKNDQSESRVVFYDANMTSEECHTSVRDSVALDERKTAKAGAKFDMEILETGQEFVTYIEDSLKTDDKEILGEIVALWNKGLCFGGKTSRGYGSIKIKCVQMISFDLSDVQGLKNWLDFDMYKDDSWGTASSYEFKDDASVNTICLSIRQKGGISIRRYTTDVKPEGALAAVPDYTQLTVHRNGKEEPVIPGTSWAGAFRHRMEQFEEGCTRGLFGFIDVEQKLKQKSYIRFSETVLESAVAKNLTRNAIDRFTNETVTGALYTERTYFGGNGVLTISWDKGYVLSKEEKNALAAAIADLHYGYLAIGGLTSVGRGIFEIEDINGTAVQEDVYTQILELLGGSNE